MAGNDGPPAAEAALCFPQHVEETRVTLADLMTVESEAEDEDAWHIPMIQCLS